jgi:hypothetical protein
MFRFTDRYLSAVTSITESETDYLYHVVRVEPSFMCAPREPTTLVSGKKCPSHRKWYHTMLAADIEWVTVFILGNWYQTSITTKPPDGLDRQVAFAFGIRIATQSLFIYMNDDLIVIRRAGFLVIATGKIGLRYFDKGIGLLFE